MKEIPSVHVGLVWLDLISADSFFCVHTLKHPVFCHSYTMLTFLTVLLLLGISGCKIIAIVVTNSYPTDRFVGNTGPLQRKRE